MSKKANNGEMMLTLVLQEIGYNEAQIKRFKELLTTSEITIPEFKTPIETLAWLTSLTQEKTSVTTDYPRLKRCLLKKIYENNIFLLIKTRYQRTDSLDDKIKNELIEQLWWVQENAQFTPQADALYHPNGQWLNHINREIPRALCRVEMLLLLRSCNTENLEKLYQEFTADQSSDQLSRASFLKLSTICQSIKDDALEAQIRASAIAAVTLSPQAQERANFWVGDSRWPYDSVRFSGSTVTSAGTMYPIYETASPTVKELIGFCFPNDTRHWRHAFFLENGKCLEALQAQIQKNTQTWLDYWMVNTLGFEGHVKSMTGSHFMTESVFQRLQLLNTSILKTLSHPKNFNIFEDYSSECLKQLKIELTNKKLALFIARIVNMANLFNPDDAEKIERAIKTHRLIDLVDEHQTVFEKSVATYIPAFLQNIAQEANNQNKHLSLIKALAWVTQVLRESTSPITSFRTADSKIRQTLLEHDFQCEFKLNTQGELESVTPTMHHEEKEKQKESARLVASLTM